VRPLRFLHDVRQLVRAAVQQWWHRVPRGGGRDLGSGRADPRRRPRRWRGCRATRGKPAGAVVELGSPRGLPLRPRAV